MSAAETPSPVETPPPAARRKRRRLVVAAALVLLALVAAWQLATWPDVEALANEDPTTTAFIERYREREEEAGREPRVRWTPVPRARIARPLQLAVLIAEDAGFFAHEGFATDEIKKALAEAWEEKRPPRGASTITQQLAKNLWLSPSRNPTRKLREAVLTWQLERELPKDRILELYLNVAELGPGIYGAEAAARHYYGTSAADLTADQAAELAASLPRPSTWHPGVSHRGYRWRVAMIRDRMRRWPWVLPG